MRLHRVLLATLLCTGCGAAPQASLMPSPPAGTSSFAVQGTLGLTFDLEATIKLLGQTNAFMFTSETADWGGAFTCDSTCNMVVDVPTAATFEAQGTAYGDGNRGATVDGVTSDIVFGDLYIRFPVTAGEATDALPVTITGTLVGYDLAMPCPPNCELSAPVWKLTITGCGTMNAYQPSPGIWDDATTVFTGTATTEPLD